MDAGSLDLHVGDKVLFPTEAGPEVATVVWPPAETDAVDLPVCAGLAGPADLARDEAMRAQKARCLAVGQELADKHGLPMKIVAVDVVDGIPGIGREIAFYFTAPGRVDFRALIGDLARAVNARIDLRQIAGREEAKLLGGVGHCGRELCCTTFLESFEPISLRLAKLQDMSVNPLQIQGACGRLLCCIAYEAEQYAAFAKVAPVAGERVQTPDGPARVLGVNLQLNAVHVRTPDGVVKSCDVGDVCPVRERARRRLPDAAQ